MTPQRQRRTLDFLQQMNEMDTLDGDTEMAARISSYELAFRMQSHAPEAVDLSKETEATRKHVRHRPEADSEFGTRCLLARRLVERGVRFVQLYSGGGPVSIQWDAHKDLVGNHEKMCGMTDLPVAGLAEGSEAARTARFHAGDLGRGVRPPADVARRRWPRPQSARRSRCGSPAAESSPGRLSAKRTRWVFAAWAPATPMRDFHATILQLLGLDQNRLWFLHNGRNEKLTDFGGTVIEEMLA